MYADYSTIEEVLENIIDSQFTYEVPYSLEDKVNILLLYYNVYSQWKKERRKKKNSFNFTLFLTDFLNIPNYNKEFIYNGAIIKVHGNLQLEDNSLFNVIDTIIDTNIRMNKQFFNEEKEFQKSLKDETKWILKESKNKHNYLSIIQAFSLIEKKYKIKENPRENLHLLENENYNPLKRTFKEYYKILLEDSEQNSFSGDYVDEKDIEEYIFKNIHKVKHGLKPISRQYHLNTCIIDILAKDEKFHYIIEIKNTVDKKLIWQNLFYRKMVAKELKIPLDKVFFLTLSTEYSLPILEVLEMMDNTENYTLKVQSIKGKIKNIEVKKQKEV